MTTPAATRQQVAADHAALANADPQRLLATVLRTRSVHAREVLVERAWPGHTVAEFQQWAVSGGGASALEPALEPEMDPSMVAALAFVLAVQTGAAAEQEQALGAYAALERAGFPDVLLGRDLEVALGLRVVTGDRAGALRVLDEPRVRAPHRAAAAADLVNPHLFPEAGTLPEWLERFNDAVLSPSAVPVRLGPGRTPFDGLGTEPLAPVDDPHRVTVLMSAYRPGPELRTAVDSVLAQTWTNLELVVVDDASGPAYGPVLEEVAALDPRVRVIRKAVNGGTYRARNTGLRLATGDFFTVVDSDDWVHPQFVELEVRALLADPSLVGVRSQGVRLTEELRLTRPGYQHRISTATSLMARVHPVLARVGFFDPTRKGADTEYARRIEAAFGTRVLDLPDVLTYARAAEGSLSAAEFSRGWRHGARHAYKCAYGPWHARIAEGEEDPFLDPTAPRRFPHPARWAKADRLQGAPPHRLDVVLGGDWRRYGGPQRSMMEEIRACREAGLTVGIMHLEAMRFMTTKDLPLCRPVQELIAAGEVEWVHPDDDLDIDVLMIRYPPILQYPPAVSGTVRARTVLVMANQAPLEPDGSDQRYVVADVTERTRELFGVEPVWVPQGPTVRRVLLEQDPTVRLTPWDNPGLIDPEVWRAREEPPDPSLRPLVVGRYSRDHAIKFPPTWEDVLAAYDLGTDIRVRIMGGIVTLRRLAREVGVAHTDFPETWELFGHKNIDVHDFLDELDFFVYQDNPQMHEAFGRVLLEAAASGVLTIAHPKHEPTFGQAVDYALPHEVPDRIAAYAADPQAYRARVEEALRTVAERFGHAGFVERLRSLGPEDSAEQPLEDSAEDSAEGPAGHPPEHAPGHALVQPLDAAWLRGAPASLQDLAGRAAVEVPLRTEADGEHPEAMAVVVDGADPERLLALLADGLQDLPDVLKPARARDLVAATGLVDEPVVLTRRGPIAQAFETD